MKVFGWICVVLGGLSLIGAASAGHSAFGPLFWLGLGITLLYFGNHKKNNEITEDDLSDAEKKVQNFTDDFCKQIDSVAKDKEKEILEL